MASPLDKFEHTVADAVDTRERCSKRNDDVDWRSMKELINVTDVVVAQTRYLGSLHLNTDKTLQRVTSLLETNNELLLRLVVALEKK
jgi:hypothetical protein